MEHSEATGAEELAAFVRTMPASYARLFHPSEMREHQRIVLGRAGRTAHAAMWQSLAREGVAVCIVTDSPAGILSLVADAVSSQDLEVLTMHMHQRALAGGGRGTVVVSWVERGSTASRSPRLDPDDLREATATLTQLIEEQQRADASRATARRAAIRAEQVRVYYDTRAMRSGECVLVIEAPDCPGLLLAVTRALFRQHAEIVASEVRTQDGLARDRFTISGASGASLTPDRLADVQQGVIFAVRRLIARQFSGEWTALSAE